MTLFNFADCIRLMVTDDLNAAESERKPQQATIYHYTDVKGALGILESGELWFTERTHLNDTAEMMYGLRIARELFDSSAKRENYSIPEAEGFSLSKTHEQRLNQFGYWIFSASLNDDDLGQWLRYADDGRGVCLGFSVDKLKPMFEQSAILKILPHVHHAKHFCVSYCEGKLRENIKRYVDHAFEFLKTLDLPPKNPKTWRDEQGVFFYINGGIYLHAMLHKHHAYEREKEYRFLISGQRDNFADYERHCVRERNSEIIAYLKLPIPAWKSGALTHIRIGPAAPDQLKDQIWLALRSTGIPTYGLTINKSPIPYRSHRS